MTTIIKQWNEKGDDYTFIEGSCIIEIDENNVVRYIHTSSALVERSWTYGPPVKREPNTP